MKLPSAAHDNRFAIPSENKDNPIFQFIKPVATTTTNHDDTSFPEDVEMDIDNEKGALSNGIFTPEDELSKGLADPEKGQLLLQPDYYPNPISCDADCNDIVPNDNILDYSRGDIYKYDQETEFISFNARDISDLFNIFIDEDYEKFDNRIYMIHLAQNSCSHNVLSCKDCDEMDRTIGNCRRDINSLQNILPENVPAYSVICPTCVTALIKAMDIPPCIKKLDALIHEHVPGIWPAGTHAVKKTFKEIMNDPPSLKKFWRLYK